MTTARVGTRAVAGLGGPVDAAVQDQSQPVVVEAFEVVADSADVLDDQVHGFGGTGRGAGGVMGQDLWSSRGQRLGQGADFADVAGFAEGDGRVGRHGRLFGVVAEIHVAGFLLGQSGVEGLDVGVGPVGRSV